MIFSSLLLLAETVPAAPESGAAAGGISPILNMVVWMAILFGFLWFFMIRPQQNAQRQRQTMWDGLKVFDKVITNGGVHGVITQMNPEEGTLVLRVDESANVKIKLEISCVAVVLSEKEPSKESKDGKESK